MRQMKVLLLAVYCSGMAERYEELGICSIASYLRKNEIDVMLMGDMDRKIDYDKIKLYNPDVIGMPVYSISYKAVSNMSKKLKALIHHVKICVGGILPTYNDEIILYETPEIDFVIRGEGEKSFLELVKALESNNDLIYVKGLTFRQNEKIVKNQPQQLIEDLNKLPWPARDLLIINNLEIAQIYTSRGCKSNCSFCASQLFWNGWRGRNVIDVVNEIEYITKSLNVSTFNIVDASFEDSKSHDLKRLEYFLTELINRKLDITYFADFRAEFNRYSTESIMEKLRISGLCGVCIGIESMNSEDLKRYNKIATVEDNYKIIELFSKYDIFVDPGIINFNPYTTFLSLRENINFMKEYGYASMYFVISRYKLFKNTLLYQDIVKNQLLNETEDYGYTFTDNRIYVLYKFLEQYIYNLEVQLENCFKVLHYYLSKYQILIKHLKRKFERINDHETLIMIKKAEDNLKKKLFDVNYNVSCWFIDLLKIAEDNWRESDAIYISNKYLSHDFITESVKILNKQRKALQLQLGRKNLEFLTYFINVQI